MDRTVLTLAVDSSQVGTAAAAFDRMVNAGNAAATSAGRVTSATLLEGRTITQSLIPALTNSINRTRTLDETQSALGQDASRQFGQQLTALRTRAESTGAAIRDAVTSANVTNGGAIPSAANAARPASPAAAPALRVPAVGTANMGQLAAAAAGARAAIERMTEAVNSSRGAFSQFARAAQTGVQAPVQPTRAPRQPNSAPVTGQGEAAPITQASRRSTRAQQAAQDVPAPSSASTAFGTAPRVSPNAMRDAASALAATAVQGSRASAALTEANRALAATPLLTAAAMAAPAVRTPLAAQPIMSAATGQRIATGAPVARLAAEEGRAEPVIERLTNAARTQRSALTDLAPAAEATARSFRQLNATPITIAQPQGLSAVAATFTAAQRINVTPLRQVAALWDAAADQAGRASTNMAQANRVIGAMPRGLVTSAAPASRNPLVAQPIIGASSRQAVPTIAGSGSLSAEAGRAQTAVERLTNAARDQRSALAQLAPAVAAAAMSYRRLTETPVRFDAAAHFRQQANALGNVAAQAAAARRALAGQGAATRQPGNAPANAAPRTTNPNFAPATPAQLQQLSFQVQDFFVQVSSGQSVLTALIQQGSQLSGAFGGIRPAFQAVLGLITPMRAAFAGAAVGVGVFAAALAKAESSARDLNAMQTLLAGTGRRDLFSDKDLRSFLVTLSELPGQTRESANATVSEFAKVHQIGAELFRDLALITSKYAQATGKEVPEAARELARAFADPGRGAQVLEAALGQLNSGVLLTADRLSRIGDTAGAQRALFAGLADVIKNVDDRAMTPLQKSVKDLDNAWGRAMRSLEASEGLRTATGYLATMVDKVAYLVNNVDKLGGVGNVLSGLTPYGQGGAIARAIAPKLGIGEEKKPSRQEASGKIKPGPGVVARTSAPAPAAPAVPAAVSETEIKSALTVAQSYQSQASRLEELTETRKRFNASLAQSVTLYGKDSEQAKTFRSAIVGIDEQIESAKKKGRGGNEASQVLRAQLQTDIRQISDVFEQQRSAYQFQNQFVEASYRSGTISLQTLMEQRREVIEKTSRTQVEALNSEETRLREQLKVEKDPSERVQLRTRINEVGAERDQVEQEAQQDIVLLNQEAEASYRALGEQVTEYRANLLQLTGDEAGAAALRAQTIITNAKQLQAQSAGRPDQITDEEVETLTRRTVVLNQFNEVQRQTSLLSENSARAEEAFALAAEQQGKSLVETERGIYEIRVKELDQLGALAQKARELAEASTDPRIKAFAADLALMYAKAADAIDPALNRLRDAQRQLAAGLANIAGNAPSAFAQEYTRRRIESSDEVRSEREVYTRRIEMLEGYLATTQDKNDKARLRERIKQEESKRDGLKGESRGSSVLKAINEAVIQPMAEQVFNTVNKLLITDPLQAYLESQLKSLTEGDGVLAGFFKDALGIKADPKLLAEQQQTAAIAASTSALGLLTTAAQSAATALNSRSPASATLASAGGQLAPRGDGYALREPAPVDVDLSGAQAPSVEESGLASSLVDARSSAQVFGETARSAATIVSALASSASKSGSALGLLPSIVSLFQAAVMAMNVSSAAGGGSGGGIFGAIAGLFGGGSGATMDYEKAVAITKIFHRGGVVGGPAASRNVSPGVFAGAPRYHTGGIVGKAADKVSADLKQHEVPAILMGGPKGKREEVLTADDPRHRDNLGMTVIARIMQGASSRQEAGKDGEDGKPGHSAVSKILQSIAGGKGESDSSANVLAGLLDRLGVKDGEESASDVLKVRGARELGGPVSARSMYRVNEKGPELLQVAGKQYLMTGAQGGKVLPNEGGQKEERPVVVNNNFTLAGPTSQASQGQIAAMATRGVKRGMRNT